MILLKLCYTKHRIHYDWLSLSYSIEGHASTPLDKSTRRKQYAYRSRQVKKFLTTKFRTRLLEFSVCFAENTSILYISMLAILNLLSAVIISKDPILTKIGDYTLNQVPHFRYLRCDITYEEDKFISKERL